jgi:hypothetical protein
MWPGMRVIWRSPVTPRPADPPARRGRPRCGAGPEFHDEHRLGTGGAGREVGRAGRTRPGPGRAGAQTRPAAIGFRGAGTGSTGAADTPGHAQGVVAATTSLLGLSSTRRAAVLALVVCARATVVVLRATSSPSAGLAAVAQQQSLAAEVDRLNRERARLPVQPRSPPGPVRLGYVRPGEVPTSSAAIASDDRAADPATTALVPPAVAGGRRRPGGRARPWARAQVPPCPDDASDGAADEAAVAAQLGRRPGLRIVPLPVACRPSCRRAPPRTRSRRCTT